MSKGKKPVGKKKEFAPSIKLYPSKSGETHSAFISEKGIELMRDVFTRAEIGGKLLLRRVGDAYREAVEANGKIAPEYEIVIFSRAEEEAFKNNSKSATEEAADSL